MDHEVVRNIPDDLPNNPLAVAALLAYLDHGQYHHGDPELVDPKAASAAIIVTWRHDHGDYLLDLGRKMLLWALFSLFSCRHLGAFCGKITRVTHYLKVGELVGSFKPECS